MFAKPPLSTRGGGLYDTDVILLAAAAERKACREEEKEEEAYRNWVEIGSEVKGQDEPEPGVGPLAANPSRKHHLPSLLPESPNPPSPPRGTLRTNHTSSAIPFDVARLGGSHKNKKDEKKSLFERKKTRINTTCLSDVR